ncbi:bifunctional demethylmenaquinone methyltransferase/2-methoxy-6-polyprenyl-1,4-benzoquinol methylase UbiE [Methylovulum psychrotolerans]|jgi:demethylmenaquinone methyltransferase/2-methoxy-6-polyprenyl-1,4-benzoquinol methylase|uniref:Ubiquinone/menaquinone biosynthesis C-methyltransferase UbiE n=1 Tax=Methylovulum psychrotolerans TaxID=1704499 RepID=A0A1Z4C1Q0_9GAMM|nr:bifunctional demethylmenaquinone methyltransferase/2-methoxy-6-polyprenyl-1,4-benzoquinol methylase UbiE [Methylovulum psychrotolerans]ASF47463.1 bifunctional demethylmenaquinone methyltransferase/2-methoxy-6-polyprenyl-1,4-benzoquinol methylase [Methylovulum psychrotolerans]MBT9097067.1 bifunctional demethylmenaquinone methyltransferase/2-methoxy-6-polyprenyl-1,4-benzoquinol methylase UbiE [Methylovulum psychrotolerans]POZ49827.1 bifunctional demethylmenaquinone methyltransferase/2-methoxy-6
MTTDNTTHFGFKQVAVDEKVKLVRGVFDSVAEQYDIMNDLMSLGIHRIWKRIAVQLSNVRKGEHVLDLAGGTGDLTTLFHERVGSDGQVVLADINAQMLRTGRDRLIDRGLAANIRYAQVNAECLPFADNTFDCVCIAFGLRNVTDKDAALRSMYRVLKPGGRVIVLEFSHPTDKVTEKVYDFYSFNILPKIGRFVAKDEESYRYLAESIRMHPKQAELKQMMENAGLERCEYFNMTQGIVAVHRGYKI